ncbi:MarR family winged helix-turn-helix transcriptional regulator [Streptomyces fulvorobeus]|uniref:MarR family transcriptional regulator n=1 Tax=Streptomyces fulvorobeus TaxID=284028 RepID=A0A7J0C7W3_9ACTN|nr:MarR family transcriptional regulator [Streptomyces fulvorobeus]NYE42203.1 DNA-binding MarR family transcriptional regulator [Streptomyces fulvorobeus]GFM98582.1 MarR family transcriptional regulator [Streptomyces fulvorobeus]
MSEREEAPQPGAEVDAIDELRAQWRRERPDMSPAGLDAMALVGRIKRAEQLLSKGMKPVFTEHGLEFAEFDVLATLRRVGAPHELTAGGLLKSAMVTSGAITNRLDRLERKGLIERHPDPADRRAIRVRLTGAGLEVVDRAVVDHVANEERMLEGLTAQDRRALDGALRRLLMSLGDTRLG